MDAIYLPGPTASKICGQMPRIDTQQFHVKKKLSLDYYYIGYYLIGMKYENSRCVAPTL